MKRILNLFKRPKTIATTFVDAAGTPLFQSEMPVEQLPQSFADLQTAFTIGEEQWMILRASPMTAAEYTRSGRLTLTIQKVEKFSAEETFFSLPTIDGSWPPVSVPPPDGVYTLPLHEDDWRQHEFFKPPYLAVVEEEMRHIHDIWENHSRNVETSPAFSKCHARTIAMPNLQLSVDEVVMFLRPRFIGTATINGRCIPNSVALKTAGNSYYGIEANGMFTNFALAPREPQESGEVQRLMAHFGMIFVDWPGCRIITAQE